MIRLTSVEVRGQSNAGPFSGVLNLSPGLQVISARNSYGKSLAVTAVGWCLGIEPIFGLFDNDPSCFPLAARDEINLDGPATARVFSSECTVMLTHNDGRQLQLTREIKGDPSVVRVEERSLDRPTRRSRLMARRQAMQDEHGGLQRFLFEWLGWPRTPVMTLKGTVAEVYLENLAPLFCIDQNEGWTDLQALQISRYAQQQISEVAVEYLLGATDGIEARVARQRAVLKDAGLREAARTIADRVNALLLRHGWSVDWSGHGSVGEILTRWSLRTLRDALLQDAEVDLAVQRVSLSKRAEVLRKALTSDPIDPADASAPAAASQDAIDLKRRRHELSDELGTLRVQHAQTAELVSSLEHRIHAAGDVLRLKATGVGRLEHMECPTCHRNLDPATFALTDQSKESVSVHIEALKRDRELMSKNSHAIEARLTTTQAEITRVDGELRDAERALETVNAAVGTVREQLAKTVADLTAVERAIDRVAEAATEMSELQSTVDAWIAHARGAEQITQVTAELERRRAAFVDALRRYVVALGHSAVGSGSAANLHLDEQYIPYLQTRRLRSLGSASDQCRLVAAYCLALAAASHRVSGLHPGFVILDEPLQQNPDEQHRKLFLAFLSKELARQATFQTVILTWLRPHEINILRQQGTQVVTPEGDHFLKLSPASAAAYAG